MLTREDIVRITESVIQNLRLVEERSSFTEPNKRTIHLKYENRIIDTVYFDVKDSREYED